MSTTKSKMRCFIIHPEGAVEEVDEDATYFNSDWWSPELFARLTDAGYPVHRDEVPMFDGVIDLRTDGEQVIVHTNGAPPHEHDMGDAAAVFLGWYRQYVQEEQP